MSESLPVEYYDSTIEPFFVPMTDRSTELYADQFGEETLFAPGLVLDIGAGGSKYTSTPSTHVIKLDPQYKMNPSKHRWHKAHIDTPESGDAVAGLAEELPFADDTFDRTLASFSIFHIGDETYQARAIAEAIRVTKPSGSVHIHPILIDLEGGDKFTNVPGISYRKSGIVLPRLDIEALTLRINKQELLEHLGDKTSTADFAKTIVRIYPLDTDRYATIRQMRLGVQALLASVAD